MNSGNTSFQFLDDLKECSKIIKQSKALKLSIVLNIIYVIGTIIGFLVSDFFLFAHDFLIFDQSSEILMNNPIELYTSDLYSTDVLDNPFRYFPLFSLLNIPMSMIPFEIAFILHTFLMTSIHVASFYLILILCKKFYHLEVASWRETQFFVLALAAPLQVPNLVFGQISEIYIFLVLLSLVFLENAKTQRYKIQNNLFFAGLMIGLSIIYKPFSILLIPFLIPVFIDFKKKSFKIEFKSTLNSLVGLILPILPNLYYWIKYPNFIRDFFGVNASAQIFDYPSTSITRIITSLVKVAGSAFPEFWFMIGFVLVLYIALYFTYITQSPQSRNFSIYFGFAFLILMITYPDSWFLYFLIWYMVSVSGVLKYRYILQQTENGLDKKHLWLSNLAIYVISNYGIIYFAIGIVISLFLTKNLFEGYSIDFIQPLSLIFLAIALFWQHLKLVTIQYANKLK